MGACGSSDEAAKRNANIEKTNKTDYKIESKKVKLLLLGTGESGKSTFFKQMKILFGNNFSEEELINYTPFVYTNIVRNVMAVLNGAKKLGIELNNQELADKYLSEYDIESEVNEKMASEIKTLWEDDGFQKTWDRRAEYQVLDCLENYCKDIDRIGDSEYIPSNQDVLLARVRTSGIVRENFIIKGVTFEVYDVGGQRSERKKWIHCFDNVHTVIFVAAINEYNQVLFEDSSVNRIHEAVRVFKDVVNNQAFKHTGFILFLNKEDIFEEKLFHYPLKDSFPEFEGPHANDPGVSPDQAITAAREFLLGKFLQVVEMREGHGMLTSHVVTLTDTKNVDTVFQVCREQILKANLSNIGAT